MIYSHIEIELRFVVSCFTHKYFQGSDEEHVQNWSSFGVVVFEALTNENTLSSRYVMGLNWYLTRAILVLKSFQSVHHTLKLKRSRRLFIQFVAFLNGNCTGVFQQSSAIYQGNIIYVEIWNIGIDINSKQQDATARYFQRCRIIISSFIS